MRGSALVLRLNGNGHANSALLNGTGDHVSVLVGRDLAGDEDEAIALDSLRLCRLEFGPSLMEGSTNIGASSWKVGLEFDRYSLLWGKLTRGGILAADLIN